MLSSRNNQEVNAVLRRPLRAVASPVQPAVPENSADIKETEEELIETHPASQEFLSKLPSN